jgi:hypothetical protein
VPPQIASRRASGGAADRGGHITRRGCYGEAG